LLSRDLRFDELSWMECRLSSVRLLRFAISAFATKQSSTGPRYFLSSASEGRLHARTLSPISDESGLHLRTFSLTLFVGTSSFFESLVLNRFRKLCRRRFSCSRLGSNIVFFKLFGGS
jgi:hypothetical protein